MPRRRTYQSGLADPDYLILRLIRDFVESHLPVIATAGSLVLDAGCGEQPFRSRIERLGAEYVGLDVVQNASETVDLIAPLHSIPLGDGVVDVVLATEVIEHVPDPVQALLELNRVLRPRGRVILTVPFTYPLHEEPHDYSRLTSHAVSALAARCGFAVEQKATLGDEFQVIALTLNNLWARLPRQWPRPAAAAFAAVRLPLHAFTNGVTLMASGSFGQLLPCKSYLTTAAILSKPGPG